MGRGRVSLKPKRRREKRGYPVAVLVGLEEERAVLWRVFSEVAKYESTIQLEGPRNDAKALYNFHEALINALRPVLREGVRSVVLVSPAKSHYGKSFVSHVQLHHAWLAQGSGKATFSEVTASAGTLPEVALLVKSASFHQILSETASEEAEMLVEMLEKRLNVSGREPLVLYSLTEIEDLIYGPWKQGKPSPEHLLLTDAYVGGSRAKGRLQRLMQIAANKGVKVKVVNLKSAAGARVAQFGGLVLLVASA